MKLKFLKLKFVHPIGKKQFQLHILRSFIIQILFICLSMFVFRFWDMNIIGKWDTFIHAGILLLLNVGILCLVFDFDKFRARYKDVFPDQELKFSYYYLAMLFPVWFYGLISYLCFKKEEESRRPSKLLKIRYALPVLLLVFVIQGIFPRFAYWTTTPSLYFITDVAHDAYSIIKLKDNAKGNVKIVEQYFNSKSGDMNSTEIVLLVALQSSFVIKDKQRREVSNIKNKQEIAFESGLVLITNLSKYLKEAELMRSRPIPFSTVQWLYPSGPAEIILLSSVEYSILRKFCPVLLDKSLSLLDGFEKKLNKLPLSKRDEYSKKISALRTEFKNSKTYRSISSLEPTVPAKRP